MKKTHRHLSVVKSELVDLPKERHKPMQKTLFPLTEKPSVCIVDMSLVSERTFSNFLKEHHPTKIFDLRTVPTFSFGRLNRSAIFRIFKQHRIDYYDVPGMLNISSRAKGKCKIDEYCIAIANSVKQPSKYVAFVMVLLDSPSLLAETTSCLRNILHSKKDKKWDVQVVDNQAGPFCLI